MEPSDSQALFGDVAEALPPRGYLVATPSPASANSRSGSPADQAARQPRATTTATGRPLDSWLRLRGAVVHAEAYSAREESVTRVL